MAEVRNQNKGQPARVSPRVLSALAEFGLTPDTPGVRAIGPPAMHAHAQTLLDALGSSGLLFITGPSGSGKSTLLREIARLARRRGHRVIDAGQLSREISLHDRRAIADLFRTPTSDTQEILRTLGAAGLADAAIPAKTADQLSDGQRDRLALALAMDRALTRGAGVPPAASGTGVPIIITDEFATRLDRLSALCLARTLRRWVDREHTRGCPFRIALATAHDDLIAPLAPDILARVAGNGEVTIDLNRPRPTTGDPLPITIEPGTLRDYHRFAHLHYRAGPPALPIHTLVARVPNQSEPIGVLLISMPALNGPWRDLAWPGRYCTGDKRADARRINDELRTIARVIVDPRCRGVGIARALVRAYLDNPLTPATEALAAMGRACPFFSSAGMTAYTLPPSRRDARLADALSHAGLHAIDLLDTHRLFNRNNGNNYTSRLIRTRWLESELRRWANDARATRAIADAPIETIIRAAAGALHTRPVAYAHSFGTRAVTPGPELADVQVL